MAAETARLAGQGPTGEQVMASLWFPAVPCDATASGAEDAQVRLTRGLDELAFCAHHASIYELALAAKGWQITHDNRARLAGNA